MRIVVNPGHNPQHKNNVGPFDPGAVNRAAGVSEGVWVRDFADDVLLPLLGARFPKIQFETVQSPWGPGLFGRINSLDPDLVVSLHLNASRPNQGSTHEALVYASPVTGQPSPRGHFFANAWYLEMNRLVGVSKRSRPLMTVSSETQRGFALFSSVVAPVALLEMFFVDNDAELSRFSKNDGRQLLALAIANAVQAYAKQYPDPILT